MDMLFTFWLVCGLVLVLSELAVPGFVIFFFGIGALVTAGVHWVVPALPLAGQCLVFVVASLLTLWLLRKQLMPGRRTAEAEAEPDTELVGATAEVCEAIRPGVPGRVLLRGVTWTAEADEALEPGTAVRVTARQNITLRVARL